jgi:hypothetical protein
MIVRTLAYASTLFLLFMGCLSVAFGLKTDPQPLFFNKGQDVVYRQAEGPAIDKPTNVPIMPESAPTIFYEDAAPAQWQAILKLAAHYWGESPLCPAGVHLLMMTAPGSVGAQAESIIGCVIYLNRSTPYYTNTAQDMCKLMVHEWGHLLGKTHSRTGSRDIMDPSHTMYYADVPVCDTIGDNIAVGSDDVTAASLRGHPTISGKNARKAIEVKLPEHWNTSQCRRTSSQEVHCQVRWKRNKGRKPLYREAAVLLTPSGPQATISQAYSAYD